MQPGLTSHIDLALVCLYLFWLFFAGLIFYLRREDRREGYPLESDVTGKIVDPGVIWIPKPKTFLLEDGTTATAPREARDPREVNAVPVAAWPGAPLEPNGDPMLAGVGPGSSVERADQPDVTTEGLPRIVPLRVATDFHPAERDPDPRGMPVHGGDGKPAGTVRDIWVDRAEYIARYLEVEVAEGGRSVLVPIPFAKVRRRPAVVNVRSILAHQFANVPEIASPDQVTRREEDKIVAYYGAGTLYATAARKEPLL